jgi:hypothetical protein
VALDTLAGEATEASKAAMALATAEDSQPITASKVDEATAATVATEASTEALTTAAAVVADMTATASPAAGQWIQRR